MAFVWDLEGERRGTFKAGGEGGDAWEREGVVPVREPSGSGSQLEQVGKQEGSRGRGQTKSWGPD